MKYLIIIAMGLLFVSCNDSAEQNKEEPATKEMSMLDNLKDKFAKEHPGITAIEWEEENGMYEVSYEEGGIERSIVYDAEGNVVEEEVEIAMDDLPEAAKLYLKDKGEIEEVCKITRADGAIAYEVDVNGEDMLFDSEGNYTGSEKDDDTDDDKDDA